MLLKISKDKIFYIFIALVLTIIFCFPYLFSDLLPIGHDTFFHLARIDGLAKAIEHSDLLPALYPLKNNNYGYASPLFYNELFIYPAAILYLLGFPLSISYKLAILLITFLTAYLCLYAFSFFNNKRNILVCITVAYLFANYRITDIYIRGAYGESIAFAFMPLLIAGLYCVYELENYNYAYLITISLSFLILSHNLSFLLVAILALIIYLFYLKKLAFKGFKILLKAVLLAFLITSFYTIPLIEQLLSQEFIVDYYAHSDLGASVIPLYKYFLNKTVFGYGAAHYDASESMLLNPGYFLMFMPLLIIKNKHFKNHFHKLIFILAYIYLLLPSDLIPWSELSFLGIIQFPWRLIMIAQTLLASSLCFTLQDLKINNKLIYLMTLLVLLEGIYHIQPVLDQKFGINSEQTYKDLIDGNVVDPYYGNTFYKRVELAGGDYLPLDSPDFRLLNSKITDLDFNVLDIEYIRDYKNLFFTLDNNQTILLPLTYYKGYILYNTDTQEKMVIYKYHGLVASDLKAGNYCIYYESTPIRKIFIFISLVTLLGIFISFLRKRLKVKTISFVISK